MPKTIRFLTTLAAAAFALTAFSTRARAQVETFETLSAYNGQGIVGFTGGNTALIETFTNVAALDSITFRFTTTGTDTLSQNFSAYLVQWNPTNGGFTGNALTTFAAPTDPNANQATPTIANSTDVSTSLAATPLESFTIPPAGGTGWAADTFQSGGDYSGYDVTLSPMQFTDPSLTYAVVLIDTTNASGLGLLDISSSDPFIYGQAYRNTNASSLNSVETTASSNFPSGGVGGDYGFSQIVVVPGGNVVSTPEPRTAAAILCAAFVAFLVGRRLLKQDEETLIGAVAA